jgi:CBS domain-containing protein
MNVQDVMTVNVESCGPQANLAEAAMIMWKRDCGVVPIVDAHGKLLGMITDRDICMAVATRDRRAAEISVSEVMSKEVLTCTPVEDVHDAMTMMQKDQIRRLPVVDESGVLCGILSLNDIALHAKKGASKKRISHRDAINTLKAISQHRQA